MQCVGYKHHKRNNLKCVVIHHKKLSFKIKDFEPKDWIQWNLTVDNYKTMISKGRKTQDLSFRFDKINQGTTSKSLLSKLTYY